MELKQYWNLFWKWKWLIVVGVVLAGGTAFLVSLSTTPTYQATTRLLVTPGSPQSSESYASLVASERLAQTYAELLKSEPLVRETYEHLGLLDESSNAEAGQPNGVSLPLPLRPFAGWLGMPQAAQSGSGQELVNLSISANPVRDTQLITVRVEGADPGLITEAANTLVEVFIAWQQEVQQSRYAESKANLVAGLERVQADIEKIEANISASESSAHSINITARTYSGRPFSAVTVSLPRSTLALGRLGFALPPSGAATSGSWSGGLDALALLLQILPVVRVVIIVVIIVTTTFARRHHIENTAHQVGPDLAQALHSLLDGIHPRPSSVDDHKNPVNPRCQDIGIRNSERRRCIHNHYIRGFLQLGQHIRHTLRTQHLLGIWWDGTSRKDTQILDISFPQVVRQCLRIIHQSLREASAVGQVKQSVNVGTAQVGIDQHHLLAILGQHNGQVGRGGRLSLRRQSTGHNQCAQWLVQ